jgi:hypothetical protein
MNMRLLRFLFQFEAALNVLKLLFLHPEIILILRALFIGCLILRILFNLALIASWKLLELLSFGSEHRLRRIQSP